MTETLLEEGRHCSRKVTGAALVAAAAVISLLAVLPPAPGSAQTSSPCDSSFTVTVNGKEETRRVVPEGHTALLADCRALWGVYNGFSDPGTLNWGAGKYIGDWDGVHAGTRGGDSVRRVRDLRLNGKGLRGSIATDIGRLTALDTLDLSFNNLNLRIPSQIVNLTKLTTLDLSENSLSGRIPSSIDNLTKLTTLELSGNGLTGSIPSSIGNLTNLTDLQLSGNRLTGSIPSSMSNLTKLTTLYLRNNQLRMNVLPGQEPAVIGQLRTHSLSHVDLRGNIFLTPPPPTTEPPPPPTTEPPPPPTTEPPPPPTTQPTDEGDGGDEGDGDGGDGTGPVTNVESPGPLPDSGPLPDTQPGDEGGPEEEGGQPAQSGEPGGEGGQPAQSGEPGGEGGQPPQSGEPGGEGGQPPQSGGPGGEGGQPPQSGGPGGQGAQPPQSGGPGGEGDPPGPSGRVGRFADDDRSVHQANIEAIAERGITLGCDPKHLDRFCPNREITRAQMMAFLARALDEEGDPDAESSFSDVADDAWYLPYLARLAELGVAQADPDGNFGPLDPLTRADMAVFLTRAFSHITKVTEPTGVFQDVPAASAYAGYVEATFNAGVTRGCTSEPRRYCPNNTVTRAQMASFLARALDGVP